MKRLLLSLVALLLCTGFAAGAQEGALRFGRFGPVTLYRKSPHPSHIVLFVSGDGGWNLGVVDMAEALSTLDALVIGIDINHYLKALEKSREGCSYAAADFELLSKFVQKRLDFAQYVLPLLVGYSSGATLVYATLVQSPPNTFCGAISLGFCPDLFLSKPLCRGYGLEWERGPKGRGYSFLPAKNLESPWIAFQGMIDQVCHPASTEAFVGQVKGGEIVRLPKVGHGFSVPRNWMPQFKETFLRLVSKGEAAAPSGVMELRDLPLVEVRARNPDPSIFAVIISGDGGWAGIDRDLGVSLAAHGISVVGLNSLQYFWKQRTPEGSAKDLERILRHYSAYWERDRFIIIGYSRGADVLPFMVNLLPPDLRDRVQLIALLGPGERIGFQFHLKEWIEDLSSRETRPVLPEVEKLKGTKILCFCGEKEKDSLCRKMAADLAKVFTMPGAHHFGGNYAFIAEAILKELRKMPPRQAFAPPSFGSRVHQHVGGRIHVVLRARRVW